jgi:hypothetical protein
MYQTYVEQNFRPDSLALIATMDEIVNDYMRQGYVLTVRQLYYQLVARDVVPNTERSYKRITSLVNDARLGGYIDWDGIEDRTRSFITKNRWENGKQLLNAYGRWYHMDMWEKQENRVFIIVEKEALAGVLEKICDTYDVPLLAARGYPSGTVLREFVEDDILPVASNEYDDPVENHGKQRITILHLGDHDPSGIDMTRDLRERIFLFADNDQHRYDIALKRIALTMDQIDEVGPPPNPAKSTDARFADYRRKFGSESWELDALTPQYLNALVKKHIDPLIDWDIWNDRIDEINAVKTKIIEVAEDFV